MTIRDRITYSIQIVDKTQKSYHLLKYKRIFLFTLLFICGFLNLTAQTTLNFQNFTQKDGLASNYIFKIYQDYQGFIWIGTENGLNRFDGQNFLVFRFDPEDPETLDGNWVVDIFEDSELNLWIETENGVNRLNRETGKIERLHLYKSGELSSTIIRAVEKDKDGNSWLMGSDFQLYKLIKPEDKSKNWYGEYFPINIDSSIHSSQSTYQFLHFDSEFSWFLSTKEILRFDISTKKILKPVYSFPDSVQKQISQITDPLYQEKFVKSDGKFFFATPNQLFVFDTKENHPELKPFDYNHPKTIQDSLIFNSLLRINSDQLLVSSLRNLELLNLKTREVQQINRDQAKEDELFPNYIRSLFKDRQENIWIGTLGSGIFLSQKGNKAFTFYQHDPTEPNSIANGQVRSMLEDEQGILWVGILNYGLEQFAHNDNLGLQKLQSVTPIPGNSHSLISNRIIKIIKGEGETIWIATLTNGLVKMEDYGGQFITYQHHPNDPTSISGNRLWALAKDSKGFIWAGAWSYGLNRIDPQTGEITRFQHKPEIPSTISNDHIRYLLVDRNDKLWIGTDDGLIRFDPESNLFTQYKNIPDNSNSLSDNWVWAIYEDQKENIWIGTNTGLNRFQPNSQTFEHFFEKDGLPDNTIYGIVEDDDGVLWVSTERGLARKLPQSSESAFLPLGLENGLGTVSFLPKAIFNSPNSERLYFGSAEGMLMIRPGLLHSDTIKPKLALHSITIFQKDKRGGQLKANYFVNENKKPLKLGYLDQSITFNISDLNWDDNLNYRYEYQLVGFNQQWMPLDKDKRITFTNLPPKKYRLLARAKNMENKPSESIDLLSIRVFPPWWKSGWAYAAYSVMILLIILSMYRFLLNRQLEKQEARNLKNLDSFKNKLYANITHEFRTPLTIISGMVEQIEKNPQKWLEKGAAMIKKSNSNLLDLVNQILDLQKVEAGNLKLDMQYGDIIPFLNSLYGQFQAYSQSKGQKMEFNAEVQTQKMDYDPEKILRIVSNLLSNAIKFTPDNGKITLSVGIRSNPGLKSYLVIAVADTGKGISKDQLPHIFDRFYHSAPKGKGIGTGIGLSLTQELVKLLGGKIEVDSEENKGSTFRVFLPINQNSAPGVESADQSFPIQQKIFGTLGPIEMEPQTEGNLPTVLIVEDNPDIADYLQICLNGHYKLILASNGLEGVNHAIDHVPNLIISDVMMPKKNGFELCETLKEDMRTSHIPIILLTARTDIDSKIIGLKHGADDYLGKPFNEEELLVRMQNLLNIRLRLQDRYKDLYAQPIQQTQKQAANKEDEFILRIKEILEQKMEDPQFDLDALSEHLNLSRSQFGRKVKALTGQSPAIFLRALRLQKARQLLFSTNLSVKEVAYEVGFSNPSYFSRSYTELFGESPSNTSNF